MTTENKSFEEMMKELESIVNQLDNDTISLEKSLELYQQGIALSKSCEKTLSDAEKKVSELMDKEADESHESKSE
ncbi:exodeoxyribonuclease VII small subunit [Staphylococcus intermedius]|uniref:Exodeoxyribonuclease 7 small subunit n=1 Tax=Staphylococcus intermedius NCTC 11048 TaxID=1141106 RepID=A0A380G9N3_STAIN|nr:exodeoxyribonuclease VII small subunit [Staphylococcus intermedius]PCF64843.1 exodeoxyribonuclease VII small subunit [Staphylococcus intermedius]PCF80453.1 exodeoxyribonuclease VII small subunit [Staphylococcus intermedius]PCF81803.1 exodeoxyribonuclease VII small subunit [Staphylococcus intermedius]PCF88140.1 exodeoxyribonuclease VII small subunit [Staphylococcus intermedius]PCF88854.1 exodeoxyribonuclease VII small subunit [Staphylococcus intermedius]